MTAKKSAKTGNNFNTFQRVGRGGFCWLAIIYIPVVLVTFFGGIHIFRGVRNDLSEKKTELEREVSL